MDSALAVVLLNCYMGRTMWMISQASGGNPYCELAACRCAYHNMQIIEGTWREHDERRLEERQYLPCNALKIGFIPIVYLSAHYCYNPNWQQWIAEKIYALGQEGLFCGEAFATTLESSNLVQTHVERTSSSERGDIDRKIHSPTKLDSIVIVPILMLDAKGQDFIAYYIRALGAKPNDRETAVEIFGRGRWSKSSEDSSRNLSIEFFHQMHPINLRLSGLCVYKYLAEIEPINREWQPISTPSFSSQPGPSVFGSFRDF